jgi:hypothetical protein
MTSMDEYAVEKVEELVMEQAGAPNVDVVGDVTSLATSELSDVVGSDLNIDGIGVSDVAEELDDLASGNYAGAAAEGVSMGATIAGAAIGVPGIDGDTEILEDLLDGNTGALEDDAEKAAIETGTSIALGAVGSIIGPEGTIIGAAVGDFIGNALAPSIEDAVSDTYDAASNLVDDTVGAFESAGDDLSDGDIVGAAGDVVGGLVDGTGDVLTGAVDLVGDAAEGVGDVVTAVGDVVEAVPDAVEDVVTSAADDVEDAAGDLVDDIEDLF